MLRFDPSRAASGSESRARCFLYLEGPGDRGVLQAWARQLLPGAGKRISEASVILGGRQPQRAIEHFRSMGGAQSGARALCVLDRDDGSTPTLDPSPEPGLEFFTWGRRHIESYLLIPEAIGRALRLPHADGRLNRVLREHLPAANDEDAFRQLDAKRILRPGGPLTRALGVSIPLIHVARATRASELHDDVHACFDRLRDALGIPHTQVVRSSL